MKGKTPNNELLQIIFIVFAVFHSFLGQEDFLEKGMAFSSILVWRIALTEATVPEVAKSLTGLSD